MKLLSYVTMILLATCFVTSYAQTTSENESFKQWKQNFAQKAKQQGISNDLIQQFLSNAHLYQRAIKNDRNQAEFIKTVESYLSTAVSEKCIANGQKNFNEQKELLQAISEQTGVPAEIIVAIWGIESNFGSYTGNVSLISSLATLSFEGRRTNFFENELLTLLSLIDHNDVPDINITGSWAGGMGMTQFIPTTYDRYGVDFDNDGHKNLWSIADALGSTGNYLQAMGWKSGEPYALEVQVIDDFNYRLTNNSKIKKPLSLWKVLGVLNAQGKELDDNNNLQAYLFAPAGKNGPKFLLFENFNVIKRYNNSNSYALAVSLLAQRVKGEKGLVSTWPTNGKKLTYDDVKMIQQSLYNKGFDPNGIDGILGNGTRLAIQEFQDSIGLIPDGFLTDELFDLIVN